MTETGVCRFRGHKDAITCVALLGSLHIELFLFRSRRKTLPVFSIPKNQGTSKWSKSELHGVVEECLRSEDARYVISSAKDNLLRVTFEISSATLGPNGFEMVDNSSVCNLYD